MEDVTAPVEWRTLPNMDPREEGDYLIYRLDDKGLSMGHNVVRLSEPRSDKETFLRIAFTLDRAVLADPYTLQIGECVGCRADVWLWEGWRKVGEWYGD